MGTPVAAFLEAIAKTHPWTVNEIVAESPVKIPTVLVEQTRLILNLFDSSHTIGAYWEVEPSVLEGRCERKDWMLAHARSFELIEPLAITKEILDWEWGLRDHPSSSRWFLVIPTPKGVTGSEGPDRTAALFKWLIAEFHFQLMAVVRDAEVLEGWFAAPDGDACEALAVVLLSLKICPEECFNFGYLAALPHANNGCELIYLAK